MYCRNQLLDSILSPRRWPDIAVKINVRELVIGTARDRSENKRQDILHSAKTIYTI
jgi:hypothetical protein